MQQTHDLQRMLGAADQRRLDQYLSAIREIEKSIQTTTSAQCGALKAPSDASDFPTRLKQLTDLAVLALQCDATRVISLMQGRSASGEYFGFVGIDREFHLMSHFRGDEGGASAADKVNRILPVIDTWNLQQLAYFAHALDGIDEGDGSLLDHTIMYCAGENADSAQHDHVDLTAFLIGGAAGFKMGRYARWEGGPSVANLFTSILNGLGVANDKFGEDGTGPLPGLT